MTLIDLKAYLIETFKGDFWNKITRPTPVSVMGKQLNCWNTHGSPYDSRVSVVCHFFMSLFQIVMLWESSSNSGARKTIVSILRTSLPPRQWWFSQTLAPKRSDKEIVVPIIWNWGLRSERLSTRLDRTDLPCKRVWNTKAAVVALWYDNCCWC